MTMCPYKWFLYLGTLLGIAYVIVETWIQYRHGNDNDNDNSKTLKEQQYADDDESDDEQDQIELEKYEQTQYISEVDDEDEDEDEDKDEDFEEIKSVEPTVQQQKSWGGLLSSTRSLRYRAQSFLRHNPQPVDRSSNFIMST